ncbi:MAG TPA: Ig-like domain-containing protein, partial [Gemmataceae bacterium]|nr:Ig-like domain-containing protein [Gemmataceae bacterium]
MFFLHPLRSLCRPSVISGRRRARPYLETLEDRTLFSVNVLSRLKGLDTNAAGGIVEPPDPIAAAGPTAVVEEVNSNIAYYDKATGNQLFTQDLGTFFSNDLAQSFFSDVNVTYDEQAGRFFVSTMDIDFGTSATGQLASYFDFAISNDSNPMHGFHLYQIETDQVSPRTGEQLFTDFPRLGWNADAYVVAFNMFGFNSEYQYNVQLLTIDKAKLLAATPTLSYHQVDRPLPNSTMVPAVMHGSAPGDPMWFVEEKGLEQDGSYADLRVVQMTNVLSATPTFTDYYVPMDAYTITPFPQDTAGTVSNVLDTRILNVDWRNDEMAVAQNVGIASDTNVHARWYEISTAGAAPSMVQQGTLNPGPGIDTYMPSVALAPDGTIGLSYMESAAGAEDMSMYVTGRAPSDPLGTMQTGVKVSPNPVAGQLYNYGGSRIGDFSGITVDPSDPTKFWAVNEYAIVSDPTLLTFPNWGTYIGHFSVDTSPGPTPPHKAGGVISGMPRRITSSHDARSRGLLLLPHGPAPVHRTGHGGNGPGGISPKLVSVHANFAGLNTNDAGGVIEPPDTIAAAGPTAIVEQVNSNIAYYDKKTGARMFEEGLDVFFAPVDSIDFLLSDVNVTYDEQAGRFFVSTMDINMDPTSPTGLASYFDFAISNDSNPLHGFSEMHQINTTEISPRTGEPLFTDFPRLGWNADAYVVAFNMFGFNSQYPYSAKLLTIDKSSVLDNNSATLSYHQVDLPLPNSTLVPAVMHGSAPGDPMWFVQEKGLEQDGSYADLRVVKMTNVLSASPTFTDYYVPLAAYTITPFPQDTMGQVSFALDTRILNVDWRNNVMAVAEDVGVESDTNVHAGWYEISTAGAAPSMVQQGTINPGAGIDTYMPSVALAPDGTIGMTYIESSATENMSMYVTGRAPTDPTGMMQNAVLIKAGEQNYQGTRIGDFSGITVDPTDNTKFWAANEYATSTTSITVPNWGTWIASFTVTPLSTSTLATHFGISAPLDVTAGTAFSFTVTAQDASNNTAIGYTGTVHFTSSTPRAALPADYTFTSTDAGVHTFSAILRSAGSQSLTATDTVTGSITGSQSITVNPGAVHHLVLSYFPSRTTAGVVVQNFLVTAQDLYGNKETGFTDTVAFMSSDSQAVLPANYTFTSADAGVHTFSATLKTAGTQSVTAKDTTTPGVISGTRSGVTVVPAATSQLQISGFPNSVTAGTAYGLTVTALDPYGNTTPSYTGTVTFTSSDGAAALPANYLFTSGDAGTHPFTATLNTAGTQSITATDTVNAGITGTESGITV